MIQKPVKHACCGTPSSMAYWLLASLLAWGLRSLVGLFWHPLGPVSASTICWRSALAGSGSLTLVLLAVDPCSVPIA